MPRTLDVLDHPVTRAVSGTALVGGVVVAVVVSLSALVAPLPATDMREPVILDDEPGLPTDEEPVDGWPAPLADTPQPPADDADDGTTTTDPDAPIDGADGGTSGDGTTADEGDDTLLDDTVDDVQDTVDDVTGTVDDLLDDVTGTTDGVTGTVDNTVDDVAGTLDDATGGALGDATGGALGDATDLVDDTSGGLLP